MYVNPAADILGSPNFECRKGVKIHFLYMFFKPQNSEVLLLYLFICKSLISVASAEEILYNHG